MSTQATDRCPNCFGAAAMTPCPQCGWQPVVDNPPPALALGQVLDGRYRIGRVLGHGGFGITYLAWDTNLHLRLAIKEYLPRDCAARAPDGVSLAVYSGPASEQFAYGLERFIEEARALARFDQHPGIVTVKNFFRVHGTGYCVMDYVDGITLRQYLDQQPGGKISVETALKLLMPVADALRAVHKEGLLHRDIAPDNIYLSQDGRIKLLDFGAARFAAGEHSKSLSILLKPGYAPEEQYRAKGKQGPWTDVYALGATFYRAITGTVPPDALDRLNQEELVPPTRLGVAITPAQEAALLKALAVKADQRWQDIATVQEGWRTAEARPAPPVAERHETAPAQPVQAPPSTAEKKNSLGLNVFVGAVVLFVVAVVLLAVGLFLDNIQTGRGDNRGELAKVEATATLNEGEAAEDRGDYERALEIYHPLAESGNARAQAWLGQLYDLGQGLPEDDSEAIKWYRKAAEQGDEYGQYLLGTMYEKGEGVSKDGSEAERWYRLAVPTLRKAAEQGDSKAQYYLGESYAGGDGVPKDETEAVRWYRKAAEQGLAAGQRSLGSMYFGGRGVAQDEAEGVRWFRKAAEQGDAAGQFVLGLLYQSDLGVTKDEAEAVRWFRKAAEQGHARAQHDLGWMYLNGSGVAKDEAEAVRWYRMAAEQGHGDGQNSLGVMYEKGLGVRKDIKEAVRWYRKAADQGQAPGQTNLGVMYADGLGVVKDEAEAVRWFRKAAEQGHDSGQFNLGMMYAAGRGVVKDDLEAVRWFRKAAEQGHARGQSFLGVMYRDGRGVVKNEAEAVRWFRKAAEQGDAPGQTGLGWMYQKGLGVVKDEAEAVGWYRKAAEQGDANAKSALGRLGR